MTLRPRSRFRPHPNLPVAKRTVAILPLVCEVFLDHLCCCLGGLLSLDLSVLAVVQSRFSMNFVVSPVVIMRKPATDPGLICSCIMSTGLT
uniref:Uncharacterized protein n=1 Tax=Arundo donax TaxID=35708 RepID=A0A0A8XRW8_ARUDO